MHLPINIYGMWMRAIHKKCSLVKEFIEKSEMKLTIMLTVTITLYTVHTFMIVGCRSQIVYDTYLFWDLFSM